MKFRKIDHNELDLLLSIADSYFKTSEQSDNIKKQLSSELAEIEDNRIIFIATNDDEAVAMVQLILKNADNDLELANSNEICHVHNLQVRKDFQRQGIGRKMMEYVEDHAKKLGKKIITLGVDGNNSRAITLYKKRGYKVFKEEEGRTAEEKLYLMKKEL